MRTIWAGLRPAVALALMALLAAVPARAETGRDLWLRNRLGRTEPPLSVQVGTAAQGLSGDLSIEELLDVAQSSLCENGPSEPQVLDGARRASA